MCSDWLQQVESDVKLFSFEVDTVRKMATVAWRRWTEVVDTTVLLCGV